MAITQATTALRWHARRTGADPRRASRRFAAARSRWWLLSASRHLERVHSPIMSPLVWDLGHIAAYEDLWLAHRHGGKALLRPDLADSYDAFETPRAVRGEIEHARARTGARVPPGGARAQRRRDRPSGRRGRVHRRDGAAPRAPAPETIRQTMAIAGLLGSDGDHAAMRTARSEELPGQEWVEIPAGRFQMGAGPEAFAYDNERPRHATDTDDFRIARNPVSCENWMRFGRRRLRGAQVVVGGGLGVETGASHRPRPSADRDRSKGARLPRQLVRGRGLRQSLRRRLPSEAESERAASRRRSPASGECGSGPTVISTVIPDLWRIPIASIPRCSSAKTTGFCEAAHGRPTHTSRASHFATGICPSAARSSPGCVLRGMWFDEAPDALATEQ